MVKLENNQEIAAAKAGMDRKTARKYLRARRLPSELPLAPRWRTRADVFEGVWGELDELLKINPGLEAKTLFAFPTATREPAQFAQSLSKASTFSKAQGELCNRR